MTDAADEQAERFKKGQRQFMTGAALVMFGLIFGGGLAMLFYFLGQKPGAIVAIAAGGVSILVGIVFQSRGARVIKSKAS